MDMQVVSGGDAGAATINYVTLEFLD